MPVASSKNVLLASSQETVPFEGSTIGASRSNAVLKPTAWTSWSEAAGGLVVFNLECIVIKLGVASNIHSVPNPQPSPSENPSKVKTYKNVGHRKPAK